MCKSRYIAIYKIKIPPIKDEIFTIFTPLPAWQLVWWKLTIVAWNLLPLCSLVLFLFFTTIIFYHKCRVWNIVKKVNTFFSEIIFWKKWVGKKKSSFSLSFSLFLTSVRSKMFNKWKSNILWWQKKFPIWSYKLCLCITRTKV